MWKKENEWMKERVDERKCRKKTKEKERRK